MIPIIAILFVLSVILLLRKKPSFIKILILSIILVSGIIWFFKGLGIEDFYSNNNHIYFDGSENDTVIMTDKSTSKFIAKAQIQRKTWNRIYLKTENDTIELNDWIEQKAGYMADINCALKKH